MKELRGAMVFEEILHRLPEVKTLKVSRIYYLLFNFSDPFDSWCCAAQKCLAGTSPESSRWKPARTYFSYPM